MSGQAYSTSPNACVIRFVGGPWDSESGLFDHAHYDSILSHPHYYRPSREYGVYVYDEKWSQYCAVDLAKGGAS